MKKENEPRIYPIGKSPGEMFLVRLPGGAQLIISRFSGTEVGLTVTEDRIEFQIGAFLRHEFPDENRKWHVQDGLDWREMISSTVIKHGSPSYVAQVFMIHYPSFLEQGEEYYKD